MDRVRSATSGVDKRVALVCSIWIVFESENWYTILWSPRSEHIEWVSCLCIPGVDTNLLIHRAGQERYLRKVMSQNVGYLDRLLKVGRLF